MENNNLELTNVIRFEITDSGNPETGRFQLEALEQHPTDTTRAAWNHVGSFFHKDIALTVKQALEELQAEKLGPEGLAAHILAMADDAYLTGHPEWNAIVEEARRAA